MGSSGINESTWGVVSVLESCSYWGILEA